MLVDVLDPTSTSPLQPADLVTTIGDVRLSHGLGGLTPPRAGDVLPYGIVRDGVPRTVHVPMARPDTLSRRAPSSWATSTRHRRPWLSRGYTLNNAPPEDIVAAVHAVARGEAVFGAGVAERMLGLFARRASAEPFPQLTEREHEVLRLMAAGGDNAALARRLGVSGKTVRNHVSTILTKLQVADRAAAVLRAREAGLGPEAPGDRHAVREHLPQTLDPTPVRRAGQVCLAAGLLAAASGVFLAVVPAQVGTDRYSYRLAAGGFVAMQVLL